VLLQTCSGVYRTHVLSSPVAAQFFGFGTAPKPTLSQIHQSIFGFNADGSPMMSPAMAPAPANKGAHDETVRAALLT